MSAARMLFKMHYREIREKQLKQAQPKNKRLKRGDQQRQQAKQQVPVLINVKEVEIIQSAVSSWEVGTTRKSDKYIVNNSAHHNKQQISNNQNILITDA